MTGKADILDAIRRLAEANGGIAVGKVRFARMTGISEAQWSGKYWINWSDAVAEAGYKPGSMNAAIPDGVVFDALADLVRSLGRYPGAAHLKMQKRTNPSFPNVGVFERMGSRAEVAARLIAHCGDNPTLADVVAICEPIAAKAAKEPVASMAGPGPQPGVVYLMKSGRHYKIGRSNSAGRRAYELAIQLPERLETVHVIETDDAIGIERYWHLRFAAQRLNGEWFSLTAADVAAFKRRKRFM